MAQIKNTDDTPFLNEINMVPFIDVSLVLLIIFMIITPQMVLNSIQVKLPKSASESTPPSKVVTVAIQQEGNIYLNNEPIQLDLLSEKLKSMSPATLEGAVIFSDREVPVASVVEVIDSVEAAGIHNINLSTERKEAPPAAQPK